MYKKTKKIPTIIALFILLFGIGGSIYLIENRTSSPTQAQKTSEPQQVQITNLSDSSFSVVYLTEEKTTGFITFGTSTNDLSNIIFDDRDIDNKPQEYLTHHISLKNLTPDTTYYFTISSQNKKYLDQNKPYIIKTTQKLDSTNNMEPSYGQIVTPQNQPAEGTIVLLNLPRSQTLSTLVKPSGNWLIPLNIAKDIESKLYQSSGITPITLRIFSSLEEKAQATTDTNNDSPVPPITIGKSYNFEGLQGKKKSTEEPIIAQNNDKEETNILGSAAQKKIEVLTPLEGATFVSFRPLFRGTAIPNQTVNIEIDSNQQNKTIISGSTKVDTNSLWSWTPPKDLSAEKHQAKITTKDEKGSTVLIERNFLVFKNGTQVLGDATPSGTIITPSPTITAISPTITPTVSATPTPIPTNIPVSGNNTPTILIISAGIFIFLIGFAKFIIN